MKGIIITRRCVNGFSINTAPAQSVTHMSLWWRIHITTFRVQGKGDMYATRPIAWVTGSVEFFVRGYEGPTVLLAPSRTARCFWWNVGLLLMKYSPEGVRCSPNLLQICADVSAALNFNYSMSQILYHLECTSITVHAFKCTGNALAETESTLLASRGGWSIRNYLGAPVRLTRMCGWFACGFQRVLNFPDEFLMMITPISF